MSVNSGQFAVEMFCCGSGLLNVAWSYGGGYGSWDGTQLWVSTRRWNRSLCLWWPEPGQSVHHVVEHIVSTSCQQLISYYCYVFVTCEIKEFQ